MVVDPGDWLPILGLGLFGGLAAVGVAGAWAVGRARGMEAALRKNDEAPRLPQGRVITPH